MIAIALYVIGGIAIGYAIAMLVLVATFWGGWR